MLPVSKELKLNHSKSVDSFIMVEIYKTRTFDSHSIPIAQIMIMTINAMVPTIRTSFTPLSMIFRSYSFNKSFKESQKPMVFMDAETAFANAKTIPTEAPNSAPRVRDMMKYIPPTHRDFYLYVVQLNKLFENTIVLFL